METFIMKACFTRLQSRRYTVYIRPYCIELSWKPHTLFWDWMNASVCGYSDMRNNNKVIEQKKDAHRHWCQMLWHSHFNRRVPTLLLLIWNHASPIQARNFAENSEMNHINLLPWASPYIVKRGIFDAIFEFKQMLFAQMSVKLLATLYRNGHCSMDKVHDVHNCRCIVFNNNTYGTFKIMFTKFIWNWWVQIVWI